MEKTRFTQEQEDFILRRIAYDPETGILTWKALPADGTRVTNSINARLAGKVAGSDIVLKGKPVHASISINYKNFKSQYVCLLLSGMRVPRGMVVDHINGNPLDNRLRNLRVVTQTQNSKNAIKQRSRMNLVGVSWEPRKKRYAARIGVDGKLLRVGRYRTKGLAAVAYAKASLRYHGQYSIFYSRAKHLMLS